MPPELKVLLLSSESGCKCLIEAMNQVAIVTKVGSFCSAVELMKAGNYDALICDWEFDDGNWEMALRKLREQHQQIPFIVFHHCGGEPEWVEVLQAGAFDLLTPPYTGRQILALLEHAGAPSAVHGCYQSA